MEVLNISAVNVLSEYIHVSATRRERTWSGDHVHNVINAEKR